LGAALGHAFNHHATQIEGGKTMTHRKQQPGSIDREPYTDPEFKYLLQITRHHGFPLLRDAVALLNQSHPHWREALSVKQAAA
jgi:hypothetical protein